MKTAGIKSIIDEKSNQTKDDDLLDKETAEFMAAGRPLSQSEKETLRARCVDA